MFIFKIYTPKKFEKAKRIQKIFRRCILNSFQESTPKKTFVISQKALMNFFECCTHVYFQNIHHRKGSKQPNDFKKKLESLISISRVCN